jgi:pilus assembly protein CpaE
MSQVFVVSDHESIAARVRRVLTGAGRDCPPENVISLDAAGTRLAESGGDLIVLALSPDPEYALIVLGRLRDRSSCRVLAVGPAGDGKQVLRVLRAGAEDYVEEAELESELEFALGRCAAESEHPAEPGRLIAVLAPSGGSGSSTLAVNVATVLAKEHKKSALVDMKLEVGDLSSMLDLKPSHNLADFCQNIQRMDRTMFELSLVRHQSGVHLLAAPRHFSDIELVTAEGVREALRLARASFPYVVVDLDHSFRDQQTQVLRLADVILLIIRLDFASLRNARRTLDHLVHMGLDKGRVRLVVNRSGQPKEVPAAKAEEALGVKIFHYVPDDPRAVNRANNNGVPVVLESPSAKVSRSVTRLAVSINGRHKDH